MGNTKIEALPNMFNAIEYLQKAREKGFTQEQAEFQAEELERLFEIMVLKIKARSDSDEKTLATKADLREFELRLRYDVLKFVVWTGVGVVVSLGGLMAKGFGWW